MTHDQSSLLSTSIHAPPRKGQEIIFVEGKRKEKFPVPPKMSELQRVEVINIFDVINCHKWSVDNHRLFRLVALHKLSM